MEHAAHAPPAPVADTAATPAAIIGALLLALLIGLFVWLAVREDTVRGAQAAAAQRQRDAQPVAEGERIRTVLINAQAAAERVWRNSTTPEQRRAQEQATLARFRAEDDATLTLQRLRQLDAQDTSASASH